MMWRIGTSFLDSSRDLSVSINLSNIW